MNFEVILEIKNKYGLKLAIENFFWASVAITLYHLKLDFLWKKIIAELPLYNKLKGVPGHDSSGWGM